MRIAVTVRTRDATGTAPSTVAHHAAPMARGGIMSRATAIGTAIAIGIEKAATVRLNGPPSRWQRRGAKSRWQVHFRPPLHRQGTRRPPISPSAASHAVDAAAGAVDVVAGAEPAAA